MNQFAYFALLFGATFIGVSLGHSLVRSIMGGGHRSPPPGYSAHQPAQPPAPCQTEAQQLGQCIEAASNDISKCQVYMDLLRQCQERQSRGF